MIGQTPSAKSKWYTEPLRRIANGLAWTVAVLGTLIAVGNEVTGFGFVPDNIRTDVTVGVGIATAVVVILQKVQGELGRNGVPGTNFNGMLSPQTAHNAMVASAQPGTNVHILPESEIPTPSSGTSLSDLGAALGAAEAVDHTKEA